MKKKIYEKPAMNVIKLQQRCMMMAGSMDANGMNTSLQDEEVNDAW